jgi:excinuclease ABC subunit B
MEETSRRRDKQLAFNTARRITPRTIIKDVETPFDNLFSQADESSGRKGKKQKRIQADEIPVPENPLEFARHLQRLEREMREAAKELRFEQAAELRDRISMLRQKFILSGDEDALSKF